MKNIDTNLSKPIRDINRGQDVISEAMIQRKWGQGKSKKQQLEGVGCELLERSSLLAFR